MRDATQTVSLNFRGFPYIVSSSHFRVCVCVCLRVSIDVCTYICGACASICMHMWRPEVDIRILRGPLFHLTPDRASQRSPKLDTVASLVLHPALFSISALLGELQVDEHARLSFYVGSGEPNSGPHTYVANTLTTRPSQPPLPEYLGII